MCTKKSSRKTVLYPTHLSLKAKLDYFSGFLMPLQYKGIVKEHKATRESVSLFETCHMGKIRLSGDKVCEDLEKILTCSVGSLNIGQCRYGFICNEQGGIIDDQIIYRIAENKFIMVVNSAAQHYDIDWIKKNSSESTSVTDISDITAKIDLQGPASPPILSKLLDAPIEELPYFHFTYRYYKNTKLLISRTGYTGEIGFEIFCPCDIANSFWYQCMNYGASPAGLGCRDTLRLEMGYPAYGQELNTEHYPSETGYTWAIAGDKTFIDSDKVLDPTTGTSKLVGIILEDLSTARNGDTILSENRINIGMVTSGSFSPSLEKSIALGYVKNEYTVPGTEIIISAHRQEMKAVICELPLYKNGTVKKTLSDFL